MRKKENNFSEKETISKIGSDDCGMQTLAN